MRPLGIPTMKDRAQQALYLLALAPVVETTADKNSYGFRQQRSCADAMEQCFRALRSANTQWILEGDIKSCFDKISHDWLLAHVLMDRVILQKWLKSGYGLISETATSFQEQNHSGEQFPHRGKPPERSESFQAAQAQAHSLLGPSAETRYPLIENGAYVGNIISETAEYLVQRISRSEELTSEL